MSYDLVVRGGTVVTASDSFAADIRVRAGRVAAIGTALEPDTVEIPAAGLLVLLAWGSSGVPRPSLAQGATAAGGD